MSDLRGRSLAVLAIAFLGLDAVLLVLAGLWTDRPALVAWGVVFAGGAVGIVWWWRRYLRHLGDLAEARRSLSTEIERFRRSAGLPSQTDRTSLS